MLWTEQHIISCCYVADNIICQYRWSFALEI